MEKVSVKQTSENSRKNGLFVLGKAAREVITGGRESCTNGKKDRAWVQAFLSVDSIHMHPRCVIGVDFVRQHAGLWFKPEIALSMHSEELGVRVRIPLTNKSIWTCDVPARDTTRVCKPHFLFRILQTNVQLETKKIFASFTHQRRDNQKV